MPTLAPIVLFTYNRPWQTEQTLKALQANDLAADSVLYIYADGPKTNATPEQLEAIKEVRTLIRREAWCGEVHIVERDKNWGLADNIINGVTEIVNEYGKIIVLEDDLVTSPGFLRYMNDALEVYADEEKVMHVSGYMFPVKEKLPETFFYNTASCWGWGTWANAWAQLRTDALSLLRELYEAKSDVHFDVYGTGDFTKQLVGNINQIMHTWAVKWYASFYLAGGAALHPYPSLVRPIGLEGSGVHSASQDEKAYGWKIENLAAQIQVEKKTDFNDEHARRIMQRFYTSLKPAPPKPAKRELLKRFLPPLLLELYRKRKPTLPETAEAKELARLKEIPRYKPTETSLLGKTLYLPDAASFIFTHQEIYKNEIYRFNTQSETPFCIDAGANIGVASIYLKQHYPQAEILAFEPDPEIFQYLEKNLQSFGYTDVKCVQKALWSEETTLNFAAEGADGGRIGDGGEFTEKLVPATRLSTFLNRPVDFLKIDIEGAEIEVLQECAAELKSVQNIFVEYHSFSNKPQRLEELLEVLVAAGFRYQIQVGGVYAKQPLIKINQYMGMDLQLNIFGYRP